MGSVVLPANTQMCTSISLSFLLLHADCTWILFIPLCTAQFKTYPKCLFKRLDAQSRKPLKVKLKKTQAQNTVFYTTMEHL